MSGPYAPIVHQVGYALMDACRYINEELGGIDGVPAEPLLYDNEAKADLTVQHFVNMVAKDPKPLWCVTDTTSGEPLHDRFIEEEIVYIASSPEACYPFGMSYMMYPCYSTGTGVFMKWALEEKWKKAGKTGRPKLATFSWDTAFGRSFVNDEVRAYAEELGVDIISEDYYSDREVDITTSLAKARDAGADWTANGCTGMGSVIWAKGIKALGMDTVNCGAGAVDHQVYAIAGSAMDGFYSVLAYTSYQEINNPGIKKVLEIMEKNNRGPKEKSEYYIVAFAHTVFAKKFYEDTIARVGWDKLSGPEILKTILSYHDDIPVMNGLIWTGGFDEKTCHPRMERMYQWRPEGPGGPGAYPVSDWIAGKDLRPAWTLEAAK
jgi:ABC-type branched-subunit amino acid transport system substrate-binding protein